MRALLLMVTSTSVLDNSGCLERVPKWEHKSARTGLMSMLYVWHKNATGYELAVCLEVVLAAYHEDSTPIVYLFFCCPLSLGVSKTVNLEVEVHKPRVYEMRVRSRHSSQSLQLCFAVHAHHKRLHACIQ
jgi:hypothetical protein